MQSIVKNMLFARFWVGLGVVSEMDLNSLNFSSQTKEEFAVLIDLLKTIFP